MKTADFIKLKNPSRAVLVIVCLLTFQSTPAKSTPPTATPMPEKKPELILSLPADESIGSDQPGSSNKSWQPKITNDSLPLIVGGRKNVPLNVDCGVDVYRNTGPDISLSSRLTGACDLKYHY